MITSLSITRDQQLEAEDEWLADYMGGRLSSERMKEFEQRLISDRQFFRRMAPFLSVLYPVEPSPIELEVRARVAARREAYARAKAERIERRRRMKALLGGVATTAFWVKAGAGFAMATTVMVATLQLEERSISAPPATLFVHVQRPAPAVAVLPPTVKQIRPIVATTTVPTTQTTVQVPVFVDPALDSALAVVDSVAARAYFAPLGNPLPTEQGRVAMNKPPRIYVADSSAGPKEFRDPSLLNGIGRVVVEVIMWPINFFRKPPDPKKPLPQFP